MRTIALLCVLTVLLGSATSYAVLVNIGDSEIYQMDATLNLRGWSGGSPVVIPFTSGEYELKFLNTSPEFTAWNALPSAGWDYWVGNMRIDEENDPDSMIFDGRGASGKGSTPEAAYADAVAKNSLIHRFTVDNDINGKAWLPDLDNNNVGGLTFEITKIPEPSSISLIALIGAGGYAIRRRFLI